jgi:hypothetical protein
MDINYNKIVFTSNQVIEKLKPILYVVHDDEDDWQFLSGEETGNEADGRIISIGTAISFDNTLKNILWLPPGTEAYRKDTGSEWQTNVRKFED